MKVNIGNYRHRCISNIHTRYMNQKYGYYEWDENNNRFESMLEKIEDSMQVVYNYTINLIKDKRSSQRISVRIDPYDTWSVDYTLSYIILPMLEQLQTSKHGSPWTEDEDVPDELKSINAKEKENEWDTDDNHHLRWDYILGEMIWAFKQKTRDDWEGDFYEYEDDPTNTEGLGLGLKLKWEDRSGKAAHQQRMTNGFRLFGKYYEQLWD